MNADNSGCAAVQRLKKFPLTDDLQIMMSGVVSALLVLAGGICAVAGYVLGSWHQRRAMEAEISGELFTERTAIDLLDDPSPRRDHRPN